ncbi:response regulator [Calycomorphotria hydatis]|uniref:Response regulatory domain-containing protein n=1 Tax=Calycomorphotria hydatis TaxID=2528027 RepID=A0A517T7A0_9PLAN|nr:response regulator [Calycomorphotria hydatis]QDT64256.1 hypothetical protein V22_14870 [Calycomorphotria hydatis]
MLKILIVDDSRAVRMVSRRILEGIGCQILEAEDGQRALDQLKTNHDIDVVLLDWNMPVLDGLSCLKVLRATEREKQPVVVMCTTENDMSRIIEAISAGANEYIMKPFTEDIVREKLETTGVL